jgi:hypothetical protein
MFLCLLLYGDCSKILFHTLTPRRMSTLPLTIALIPLGSCRVFWSLVRESLVRMENISESASENAWLWHYISWPHYLAGIRNNKAWCTVKLQLHYRGFRNRVTFNWVCGRTNSALERDALNIPMHIFSEKEKLQPYIKVYIRRCNEKFPDWVIAK